MTLRTRLLLAFLAPTLVLLLVGGFGLFRVSEGVLEKQLGESLSSIAGTVAAELAPERVLAITPEDAQGEGSRTYRSLHKSLEAAQRSSGTRRIFVFDAQKRSRVDVGGGLPPGVEVPDLLRDSLELEDVFKGKPNASQVLFQGADGQLYKTGYAPIVQDGVVVAVVAVEGSAAFFGPLTDLRNAFMGLAALALVLLAVVAVLSARQVSQPLEELVRSAQAIAKGDLVSPVRTHAKTVELAALSHELELMRSGLESRDRQLKMMLGGVAHEVKNPLGGIELFSGLVAEELGALAPNLSEAREHLGHIRRELDYLKRIVDDFLSFAREQRVVRTSIEVHSFVTNSVAHLLGEASARNVHIVVDVQPFQLTADESLLTSALVNLVKNAVQVSKSDQTVHVRGFSDTHSHVVEVCDEGPGIPKELQARVFEPFYTTREKGTGLGLPLARKLVEANGGRLKLESTPGKTVFQMVFPRADRLEGSP